MDNKKVYYRYLDIIRVFFCIAILFYHLDIIKGGYLAVCSFFALSGYLSVISSMRKDNFSLKNFYISRIKKIYLPLVIVVFLTVAIVNVFDIIWLNLKPETTSILLGFNNFWQLSVNLDYFAHHIDSPFMHLWYVAILLQFELIFPLIYIPLKKLGDKVNKLLPGNIMLVISILGYVFFYRMCLSGNLMFPYYNTFTRVFSLTFGVALGFLHGYFKPLVPKLLRGKKTVNVIMGIYMILLTIMFFTIDASNKYFCAGILLSTLFALRLIDYSCINNLNEDSKVISIIKYLSSISYELFLVQYPVIFLFQYIKWNVVIETILIIIITFIISSIIHFILKINKEKLVLKLIMAVLVLGGVFYGEYIYVITEDHSKEMKQLEDELTKNAEDAKRKQEQYKKEYEDAQREYEEALKNLDKDKDNIKNVVDNLPVVGIGDSVMLGAVKSLESVFPKGIFNGEVSRTAYAANDILLEYKNSGVLGDYVVFNLGTNGDSSAKCKAEIMETLGNREVYWLTVTNDEEVHFNDKIKNYASKFENVHVIDWAEAAKGHDEYFYADGIHLTPPGRKAYAEVIYNAIYQGVLDRIDRLKSDLMQDHENSTKNKITFYGNDLLLNSYDLIEKTFNNSNFEIDSDYTTDKLIKKINNSIKNKTLTNTLVFVYDSTSDINYKKIIDLVKDKNVYIITTKDIEINVDNVKVINIKNDLNSNADYLRPDKTHLTDKGKEYLNQVLIDNVKKSS